MEESLDNIEVDQFLLKTSQYHCKFCNCTIKGTLLQFCNHIEIEHFYQEPRDFIDFEGLVRHNEQVFLAIDEYLVQINGIQGSLAKCPYCCNHNERTKKELLLHVHSYHDPVCPKCPQIKESDRSVLQQHFLSRKHAINRKFTCSSCPYVTYIIESLWKHRLERHKEELSALMKEEKAVDTAELKHQTFFKCPINMCSFSHAELFEVKIHVHVELDPVCPHCTFKDPLEMERHLKLDHDSDEHSYVCQSCEFKSSRIWHFWSHRLNTHPDLMQKHPNLCQDTKEPIECVYCHKFVPGGLQEMFWHIHASHDPCCTQCNYVEKQLHSMKAHMTRFNHVWNDMDKIRCSSWGCVGKFESLQSYWHHRKTAHQKVMKQIAARKVEDQSNLAVKQDVITRTPLESIIIKSRLNCPPYKFKSRLLFRQPCRKSSGEGFKLKRGFKQKDE